MRRSRGSAGSASVPAKLSPEVFSEEDVCRNYTEPWHHQAQPLSAPLLTNTDSMVCHPIKNQ